MKLRSRLAVVFTALTLTTSVLGPASPAFAYSTTPVGPAWTPDGPVLAVVTAGQHVIVGGGFTGGVAALNATTGALEWRASVNGGVRALALSADGQRVIAGGSFTEVDGVTHRRLASLSVADGISDPRWRPAAGGLVRDIVVTGDTAYFGGAFRAHNRIAQRGLGAVSVSTGKAVTAFSTSTDGKVFGLATNGSKLVIGGKFTTVNGSARNALASVTLAGYSLDSWNPARACTRCNAYWDVLMANGSVFAAGRNGDAVVAFDLGQSVRRWRVTANGDAQALAFADGRLYAGGHFTWIGGQQRSILAALNPSNGAIDREFTPRFVDSWPGIWALEATSTRLYVGGYFSAAGPTPPRRYPYFAMFG